MHTNELKKEVLQKFFRGQCNMLGQQAVSKIVNGPVELVRSEGGSDIDTALIVTILLNSVTFVDAIINIYKFLQEKGTTPTYSNVSYFTVNNNNIAININLPAEKDINLTPEKREEMIRYVIERLDQLDKRLP